MIHEKYCYRNTVSLKKVIINRKSKNTDNAMAKNKKGQTVQVMIYKALGRVSSSCFTYDTRRITRVTIPVVIVHK
jgi:hypothetical protein